MVCLTITVLKSHLAGNASRQPLVRACQVMHCQSIIGRITKLPFVIVLADIRTVSSYAEATTSSCHTSSIDLAHRQAVEVYAALSNSERGNAWT